MLQNVSIKAIIKTLEWIATLGKVEIKEYKTEVKDLIMELSKSLTNLWDVVTQVTDIKKGEFSKESFEQVSDYFFKFYAGDLNISPARTHCGNVERLANRLKFKVAKRAHGDLGKWAEIDDKLKFIIKHDGIILTEYDNSIKKIDSEIRKINKLLDRDLKSAKKRYFSMKGDLKSDIRFLKDGVKKMETAINHVNKHVG